MQPVIDIVSAIRTIRSESRIAPGAELQVTVKPGTSGAEDLAEAAPLIGSLARSVIAVDPAAERPPQSAHAVAGDAEVSFTSTAWSISRPSAAAS